MQQLPLGVRLRAASTLEGFEVGEDGALVAAIEARASRGALPPLYLWAAPGCGRTHLLQAACARAADAGRRAGYLPLGEPWPDPAMLAGLEALDLVCLDDLDGVLGRDAWERALFRLYNDLMERGGNLVLSAGGAPAAMTVRLQDLASRLAASVVFQVQDLSDEQQGQVLQARARSLGIDLPDDTLQYLQRRLPRDLSHLCEALDRLDAASLSLQRRLTVPFVRETLGLAAD
jgi:DnaA family protein